MTIANKGQPTFTQSVEKFIEHLPTYGPPPKDGSGDYMLQTLASFCGEMGRGDLAERLLEVVDGTCTKGEGVVQ